MTGVRATLQRREAVLDFYTLACGAFLLAAPWLFGFIRPLGRLDAEVGGFAVILLSLAAIALFAEWEEWLKLAVGLALIAAPWALGFTHTSAMHVSIAVGVVVAYLALLELWLVYDARRDTRHLV